MVATEIRQYIREKGIMQKVIAKNIGVSPSLLSQYLRNDVKLPADVFFKICDFLEVSPERFRSHEEDNNQIGI